MSIEFYFRLAGMIGFAIAGAFLGDSVGRATDQSPQITAILLGLTGALVGLILTPYITTRPVRAIRRVLLIHGIILSIGGIPLIYLGDEVGTLNDYSYRDDPAKSGDSRWVHRPFANWEKIDRRNVPHTLEAEVYGGLQRLIAVRKETEAFSGGAMSVVDADNPHVFGYVRQNDRGRILALANLSEREQRVTANTVRNHGLSYSFRDLIRGDIITLGDDLALGSYQLVWLMAV